MKSIHEEEMKQTEKEYQEAEVKEKQKHMKYKWIWTPRGWLIVALSVSCLGIAGWLDASGKGGTVSTILLVLGIFLLVFGWVRTFRHTKKMQDESKDKIEEEILLNMLNDNWVSEEKKNEIRNQLREKGYKI